MLILHVVASLTDTIVNPFKQVSLRRESQPYRHESSITNAGAATLKAPDPTRGSSLALSLKTQEQSRIEVSSNVSLHVESRPDNGRSLTHEIATSPAAHSWGSDPLYSRYSITAKDKIPEVQDQHSRHASEGVQREKIPDCSTAAVEYEDESLLASSNTRSRSPAKRSVPPSPLPVTRNQSPIPVPQTSPIFHDCTPNMRELTAHAHDNGERRGYSNKQGGVEEDLSGNSLIPAADVVHQDSDFYLACPSAPVDSLLYSIHNSNARDLLPRSYYVNNPDIDSSPSVHAYYDSPNLVQAILAEQYVHRS